MAKKVCLPPGGGGRGRGLLTRTRSGWRWIHTLPHIEPNTIGWVLGSLWEKIMDESEMEHGKIFRS